ncbi:UvrD-helicase domain-containing protein [Telmatobacter sp. DSM 110680]|uniref:DNA 3'-5' helicase n=1 Tax=Telmatobacter sp. DSM 110680 TaxID=3036704 RepID=A0AAU7DK33_9BACT
MSDSRAIDQESRRIVREELVTNILLEAGAGSGKTQMLAERMAAGVAAGVYKVEQMAAVTFTRKAASELRGRFHLALESQLSKARETSVGDTDAERINRIQSALSNMERFFGGTIHSFCARLLRERPVESGVSPGFTELDEVQDIELRRRVWRDFIASRRECGDPVMIALLEADLRPRDLDSAFATICANDDVEFPAGEGACPDPKPAREALEQFWVELRQELPTVIDPKTTCKIQDKARQFQGLFRVSQHRLERPSVVASLLEIWDCESKIVQKCWADAPAEKKRLRDLIEGLHGDFHTNVVVPYLAQWRQYVYRLSVTLLIQARESAGAERRRINSLNYGDLLNLTARVLRENEPVRRTLQQKYKFLLVDEFQDTDPVQAEILFWLAEDIASSSAMEHKSPLDWRTLPVRPGALFVVGDPKQSIYRFRRADIDIYNVVRRRFSDPTVGRVVPLTLNFRSVPQLCNWANEVFIGRFPAEPTLYAPRFAPLDADTSNLLSGGVYTITHSCKAQDVQAQDAAKIATHIRAEVDAGRRRFRDFLILTRKKRDRIAPYADALTSLNIPVEVSGAGAFGESTEVEALTVLLRALADPQDAVSLIAVLRGPLFGLSDPELFAFKQAGGWFSLFYDPGDAAEAMPHSRTHTALRALRQYYRWTSILPAAAALDRILEDTGYLALAGTTPGGANAGDVLHAVDRVRRVTEAGGSLADAADSLEADSEAASEVESLPLEPGRTDVVRLMNLHKAKGLEAAVVFLADPAGGVAAHVDVHIERTELKALGWLKIVRRNERSFSTKLLGEHEDWPVHEAAEMPYLQAEEDRLLYVAATRGREALVVSRWTGGRIKSPAWGVLNDSLSLASELSLPLTASVPAVGPLDCSDDLVAAAAANQAAAHSLSSQPSWHATSVTNEARHIANITPSLVVSADDPSKVLAVDSPSHRADAGLAWGTLIHGLLEHAMRHKNATSEDLKRLGMWLTVEEPQLRQVLAPAVNTVLAVSKLDFWDEAKKSECSVEAPFAFAESPRVILNGVIDLLFGHDGHWRIIDYKTDLDSTNLGASYQAQLNMYERALGSVGIQDVTSALQPVRSSDG